MAAASEAPDPNGADTGNGALAQLGERLHGMQEVSGSIPLSSTNFAAVRENGSARRLRPLRLVA